MINLKSALGKSLMSLGLAASLVIGGVALLPDAALAGKSSKHRQSSKAKANSKNKIGQNAKQSNKNSTHQHAGGAVATGGVVGSVLCINTGAAPIQIPVLGAFIFGPGNVCGNGNTATGGVAVGGVNVNTNDQANANVPVNAGNQAGGTAGSGQAGTVADASANS